MVFEENNLIYILKKIPLTYPWIVRKAMGNGVTSVIDLGCGDGKFMSVISRGEEWNILGVDLHKESVAKAKQSGVYKRVVTGNVTNLPKWTRKLKFDLVFSSQVLEHLKRKDGMKAIKDWESLSRRRFVLSTTVGFIEFRPIGMKFPSENPYQTHLSGWKPQEFRKRGYTVRGQGLKLIYGSGGLAVKFPFFYPILAVISYIFSPLVYFVPEIAAYMVVYKDVEKK